MTYKLYATNTFSRKLKAFLKSHPELEETVKDKFDEIIINPFSSKLKAHKLYGKLKNEWSVSLTYEHRILFVIQQNNIYLTNIGTHDEVY
jgi:mRNA-degrading endonuclease YafQ of YafQ-DinJ toxin-antitoxin module